MNSQDKFEFYITTNADVVQARQFAREYCARFGFSLSDQTRFATALSELTRNTLQHSTGGVCFIENISDTEHDAIKLTVEDNGPGINDVERSLLDGFSTGSGLGAGLPGSKRLLDDFFIQSKPGLTKVGGSLRKLKA